MRKRAVQAVLPHGKRKPPPIRRRKASFPGFTAAVFSLLVASMAGQKALSSQEIGELYAILREAESEGKP